MDDERKITTSVLLPASVVARIRHIATTENRSMSNLIFTLVEEALHARDESTMSK